MAAELVKCRILRRGYLIERGEIMCHVDFDKGDSDEQLRKVLKNAVERNGGTVSEYEIELFDKYGNRISTYVS